jgi:hypothetical protein
VLPGKSKKEEYVVFSGHYDHLGIGKPNAPAIPFTMVQMMMRQEQQQ